MTRLVTTAMRGDAEEHPRGEDPDVRDADERLAQGDLAGPLVEDVLHEGDEQADGEAPPRRPETMTISVRNGIRIVQFDAPTSRMMPISRRRMNAAWRIVVAMSRAAQATMSAARSHREERDRS